ncbi:NAD(P)H-dependent oxidoreductase [Lactiplantibacillus pingfangensis]|uniref:NAD(P)H-dependent oxidoreductase n=1 Tax=Lactiplantibacillus pingfangensis TaxID=2559915 RepID=UPI0010F5EEEA|nr:NAD(P)H-dependent oxidoreductase [Lactiplantibacillus pingfangensis]
MKTIVYAHPYEGSLNHGILERLTTYFAQNNQPYQVIDLYQDGFDPRFSKEELRLFSKGESPYQLVHHYQEMIRQSDELLFITPIWWYQLPAELKGFLDKVMLTNFAYRESPEWQGLLTYIHKTTVITTSTVTKDYLQTAAGDPIQKNFINRVLADLGLSPKHTNWIHLGGANTTTDSVRQAFLADLPELYLEGQD